MNQPDRPYDALKEGGHLALASRLKRLADRLGGGIHDVYKTRGVDFESRWFPVFSVLAKQGPQSVGEVAKALGWSHAAVSQTASKMSKSGVLTSERDERDERRRVLALTDEGHVRLAAVLPVWSDIEAAVKDVVDHAGFDLLAALDGIEDALAREDLAERCGRLAKDRVKERVKISPLRPHRAEDRDGFEMLNRHWLERTFSVEPADVQLLEHPQDILQDGGTILLARVPGEAGIAGTVALVHHGEGRFELTMLTVEQAQRGRQIGRALVEAALAWVQGEGAQSVFLLTHTRLAEALALFRSVGFTVARGGAIEGHPRADLEMSRPA